MKALTQNQVDRFQIRHLECEEAIEKVKRVSNDLRSMVDDVLREISIAEKILRTQAKCLDRLDK